MSLLTEKAPYVMSWGMQSAVGARVDGRTGLLIMVDTFRHKGVVAIFPNEQQPGYFDIEVHDGKAQVLRSVEYVSACNLVEMIDQLVEVTETYFDDIDRWVLSTPNDVKQYQQLGRIIKRSPEIADTVRIKMVLKR